MARVDLVIDMGNLPHISALPYDAWNAAVDGAISEIKRSAVGVVPMRTGRLLESMRVEKYKHTALKISFDRRGGLTRRQIAHVIDAGAPPHTITAKKAKALQLQDGRFRKSVEHPGFIGRGYLFKMKEIARQIMTQHLLRALAVWRG